ncbi:MAG TPA: 2-oxo acid dehydrogenase subunit E2 [Candidatus Binatia bacterium]
MSSLHKPKNAAATEQDDAASPQAAVPQRRKPPYSRVTSPSSWRRLALVTWSPPDNPTVYGTIEIDMTESLALIQRMRETEGIHVTVTHLVTKALALGLRDYPDGNGLIIGKRLYKRDEVDIFCQVSSEDGRDLSGVKLCSVDRMSLRDIAQQLNARVAQVRARKDREVEKTKASLSRIPDWLLGPAMRTIGYLTYDLGLDLSRFGVAYDQFGSAMVTSIGLIDAGLGMALAPLVPFSRVPIVVLVNNIQRRPAVVGDQIMIRPILTLGCTFDHRFIDGVTAARIAASLRRALTHPYERLA